MGFWDVLKDIDDTLSTVDAGYNRALNSKNNYNRVMKEADEFFESQWAQIDKWERKTHNCKIRTVVLCILMIVLTICVCVFL